MIMVLNKIGKGGGWKKSLPARLAPPTLVAYVEPKIVFF
jgi:hypothetical protein